MNGEQEQKETLSCDSCGWVIKPDEIYAEKDGEIICEHCLEAGRTPKELH
jgi:formylmethanofuran dehydrogenase subunit E